MPEASRDFKKYLLQKLKDPVEAAAYIEAALEDGDEAALLVALRDVVEARSISEVAKSTGLNRENLYRMLAKKGNPRLTSLFTLFRAVGLRLSVEVITQNATSDPQNETALLRVSDERVKSKIRKKQPI